MTAPQQQKRAGNPYYGIQRQPAYNASGSNIIPAFGLVRVTDTRTDGALIVDQPNADGQDVYVNGPIPIRANGYGIVSRAWPIWAAYNNAATPGIGDTWGAANGSYLLTQGKGGFTIHGQPIATGVPRVLVVGGTGITSLNASRNTSTSLATTWTNVSSLSLSLPKNSRWLLNAQLTAQITSAAAADYISFRYYDGTTQYGVTASCCDAVCASINFLDSTPLTAIAAIGSSAVTLAIQAIVNTSSGSSGQLLAGYLAAVRLP